VYHVLFLFLFESLHSIPSNGRIVVMSGPRIVQLSEIISTQTKKIQDYFAANGLPDLSFDPTAPGDFPVPSSNVEMHEARRAVVNATQELHDLMVGPRESVRWAAWNVGHYPCCVTSQILAYA
jgi:hypothetical protein